MTRSRMYATAAAVCLALAAAAPARAAIITATEPNNTFATAQNINGNFTLGFNPNIGTGGNFGTPFVNTSTTIPNVTILRNNATGGLDYFSFTTTSAGLVILDIDSSASNPLGGGAPPQNTNFDTQIFLFNSAGGLLASNDDNGDDPGDTPLVATGGAFNSRIETTLAAGTYVVGVAAFFSTGGPGGVITGATIPTNGTYTLQVSANAAVTAPIPAPAGLVLGLVGLGTCGLGRLVRRKRSA